MKQHTSLGTMAAIAAAAIGGIGTSAAVAEYKFQNFAKLGMPAIDMRGTIGRTRPSGGFTPRYSKRRGIKLKPNRAQRHRLGY